MRAVRRLRVASLFPFMRLSACGSWLVASLFFDISACVVGGDAALAPIPAAVAESAPRAPEHDRQQKTEGANDHQDQPDCVEVEPGCRHRYGEAQNRSNRDHQDARCGTHTPSSPASELVHRRTERRVNCLLCRQASSAMVCATSGSSPARARKTTEPLRAPIDRHHCRYGAPYAWANPAA